MQPIKINKKSVGFFQTLDEETDIYKLRKISNLNTEEVALIEDIARYLSDESDLFQAKEYIGRLLKMGGHTYLTIVNEHITNNVLPMLIGLQRVSTYLESMQPGMWRQHNEVLDTDYNNLIINRGVLKRELKTYLETQQPETPRLR